MGIAEHRNYFDDIFFDCHVYFYTRFMRYPVSHSKTSRLCLIWA